MMGERTVMQVMTRMLLVGTELKHPSGNLFSRP
jgi:hypothetical protein